MKTTMTITLEDLIRIVSGYLGQKFNNQLKLKPNDFSFVITDGEGNPCFRKFGETSIPALKEIQIEYDSKGD